MARDVKQIIAQGSAVLSSRRDLGLDEFNEIIAGRAVMTEPLFYAFEDMFHAGVALGYMQAQADAKKKHRSTKA